MTNSDISPRLGILLIPEVVYPYLFSYLSLVDQENFWAIQGKWRLALELAGQFEGSEAWAWLVVGVWPIRTDKPDLAILW